jgi:hypothetical protein
MKSILILALLLSACSIYPVHRGPHCPPWGCDDAPTNPPVKYTPIQCPPLEWTETVIKVTLGGSMKFYYSTDGKWEIEPESITADPTGWCLSDLTKPHDGSIACGTLEEMKKRAAKEGCRK